MGVESHRVAVPAAGNCGSQRGYGSRRKVGVSAETTRSSAGARLLHSTEAQRQGRRRQKLGALLREVE